MDVLVDGKHFDALQVGVRVLWEIKTDQFDTYSDFLQEQVVEDQMQRMCWNASRRASAHSGARYRPPP
jgi:hypothetical protein